MHNLIIYGGTFDPIHNGHLHTALAVQRKFHFERFLFLPCKSPTLKNASMASTKQRVNMLQRALAPYPEFEIGLQEIERDTPSFMVETLRGFRHQYGEDKAITLLIGIDAFLQLPRWHRWGEILQLSHILVIKRPGFEEANINKLLATLLLQYEVFDTKELLNQPCGKIYRFDAGQYDISSTTLREKIKIGDNVEIYLPAPVNEYIKEQALYQ